MMSPRCTYGWMRGRAGDRQRLPQAGEACEVVRPETGQEPLRAVVGGRVDRRHVDPEPACHRRQGERRQGTELTADRALEADPGIRPPGGKDRPVVALAIGIGVGVKKEIEPGRRPQVEEGERLARIARRDEVEGREEGGAAADLVGLGAAGGEKLEELGPMGQAEAPEVADQVAWGRLLAAAAAPAHRLHAVVVGGEGMAYASEEEEMHGCQQQVRPALPKGHLSEQRQDVRVVGHSAADDVVGGGAVFRRPLGKGPELLGERKGRQGPTAGPAG